MLFNRRTFSQRDLKCDADESGETDVAVGRSTPRQSRASRRSHDVIAVIAVVRRSYALVSEGHCSRLAIAIGRVGSMGVVLVVSPNVAVTSPWSMGITSGSLRRLAQLVGNGLGLVSSSQGATRRPVSNAGRSNVCAMVAVCA